MKNWFKKHYQNQRKWTPTTMGHQMAKISLPSNLQPKPLPNVRYTSFFAKMLELTCPIMLSLAYTLSKILSLVHASVSTILSVYNFFQMCIKRMSSISTSHIMRLSQLWRSWTSQPATSQSWQSSSHASRSKPSSRGNG